MERPILFSGSMVRAILAGQKTQTRRMVKQCAQFRRWDSEPRHAYRAVVADDGSAATFLVAGDQGYTDSVPCPYGKPGDRLWVRETWGTGTRPCPMNGWRDGIEYRADVHGLDERDVLPLHESATVPDDVDLDSLGGRWRPSIHMPRWASRITLEVSRVRVERLQSISEEDAKAEGVQLHDGAPMCPCQGEEEDPGPTHLDTCPWRDPDYDPEGSLCRDEFAILWNSINGKKAPWSSNPWVWVLEFKRVEQEARAS